MIFTALLASAGSAVSSAPREEKVCGVYTHVLAFAPRATLDAAADAEPPFLMGKHRRVIAGTDADEGMRLARDAGFNTLFMTIWPIWGQDWWDTPEARALVSDAVARAGEQFDVHLGLSLFNANFCADPSRFPGALPTLQCDGTRPTWICYFDDRLWDYFIRNAVEMAKIGAEHPGKLKGIFLDPEAYGPELYLCVCNNCVAKFNAYSSEQMPADLVKPDSWLHARGLWEKYTVEWHGHEVRRHATALREAVDAIDPDLQLASLLWDYPVAVGVGDPRQQYFRMLAIGLGTPRKPAWTMPEHTYYSDGDDLRRIIGVIEREIADAGAAQSVQVLPAIRLLRQPPDTLAPRGQVIRDENVPGYWMYELADLGDKTPAPHYIDALREMNENFRR
jgi:hypothetical protein